MPAALFQALNDVRCARPFALLGWQHAEKGLLIRAFLPSALQVTVLSAEDGSEIGVMSTVDGSAGDRYVATPPDRRDRRGADRNRLRCGRDRKPLPRDLAG